ncbi:MAG: SRPBCC domain-containing protein [Rhizomicrobium sp.]
MADLAKYTLTRILDAPRELVFEMWTDPKHFRRWWGPKGSDNGETRLDLRVGGNLIPALDGMEEGVSGSLDPLADLLATL